MDPTQKEAAGQGGRPLLQFRFALNAAQTFAPGGRRRAMGTDFRYAPLDFAQFKFGADAH